MNEKVKEADQESDRHDGLVQVVDLNPEDWKLEASATEKGEEPAEK